MSFSEWREVKLEDIIEIEMGQSPKSEFYNQTGEGLPFLQGNRTFGYKYPYFDTYCTENKKIANKNDVIMSVRAPVGDLNIAQTQISLGRGVCAMRLKGEQNSNYLFYLMKHNIKEMINRESGTVFGSVNKKDILGLDVKITNNKLEQKAIAHILSTLDDKIEVNNQINKTLENMAQAIFKQWFVDFEFPNEDGEPYKSSGGEMVESELGMIPKGWEVKELVDVLETLEAGNRPKGGAGNLTEGIPSIGAENIIGLGKYDYSKEKYVTEEYFAKMNKGKVNPGDVLLYKDGAQLGRKTMFMNGFPHKKCCINSHVFILRTNDMLTQSYLYFWLDQDWVTQSIINLNANSAQPGINQSKLKTLKILTPMFNYVEMFDVIIKSLLNKLFENCIENNALHKTRDALLPKLMSGEIRVPLDEEGDVS